MRVDRQDVIMAGIGGKGVLAAGQILARAALGQYAFVSWTPTYFTLMRGGASECTVIMTNSHLGAPVLPRARNVIIFEASQVPAFQERVALGGSLIVESAGLPDKTRSGIQILKVPAVEVAAKLGDTMAANLVLLGAYLGTTQAVSPSLVEKELEKRFGQRPEVLELNRRALNEGLKFA